MVRVANFSGGYTPDTSIDIELSDQTGLALTLPETALYHVYTRAGTKTMGTTATNTPVVAQNNTIMLLYRGLAT